MAMSNERDGEMTVEEAQEAVDNGDTVTMDELQELHPNTNLNNILYKMQTEQAMMEFKQKVESAREFNEPRHAAKQGRKTCHTGPKGVLTDFEEAKLKLRAHRITDKIKREKKVYMNLGNDSNINDFKLIDMNKAKFTNKQIRTEKYDSKSYDEDSDEDNDDVNLSAEDKYLYEMQRMKLIQNHLPRYGDTKEVTAWTFDEMVENAPKNVVVVMHIYQDYMERCMRMNYAIGQLAKSYPHIRFLRARSDRIGLDTYPEVGLPTIIVFKNGQQLQNHIAVHDTIGNPFQPKDVENFLIENKVIKQVVALPDAETFLNEMEENENNKVIGKKSKLTFKNNSLAKSNKVGAESSSESELDID